MEEAHFYNGDVSFCGFMICKLIDMRVAFPLFSVRRGARVESGTVRLEGEGARLDRKATHVPTKGTVWVFTVRKLNKLK